MRLADVFFWFASFFIGGLLIASVANGFREAFWISLLAILLAGAAVFFAGKIKISVFALAAILGAGYFFLADAKLQDIPFGKKVELSGIIVEAEQRLNSQKLIVAFDPKPSEGTILIQIATSRYPEFEYGDRVKAVGVIKSIEGEWERYFKKEGVAGLMQFPKIEFISKNNGSPVKAKLLRIKKFFESSYKNVLPFEQAAFLSGLTIGSTAEFSDEFKEKLRLTGTTHLVALSGYNISILVRAVGVGLAGWWFTKKLRLPVSVLFVIAFVVMTGAEPSVVRAAIMAMIMLIGDQIGRATYIRNAIAGAALIMVLMNPRILAFDIGFQLSFMALIGIVYFEPWLRKKLKAREEAGVFGWRAHFWTTTSAQLAVLPIVIYHFGFVSPISVPTNVLLLEFIPITMGLGFSIALAAIINPWLSWLIAIPAQAFLGYELSIINIFSTIITGLTR